MIKNIFKILLLAIGCGCLYSCSTQKREINYLKDIESIAVETSLKNSRSTIQPGDQMVIVVSAKDMDVVKPFNQHYSSTPEIAEYSQPNSNRAGQSNVSGPTYTVDSDGYINFNVIGKISTTGLNIEELSDNLRSELTRYIKNPVVTVKTVNYKITMLGEVNKPGTYVIPDGNITVLSALGLAGDLTLYGVRNNVLVVRNIDGQISKERIDLTSANFINSPYYYLKQNDVVYVEANETKEKTASQDPNTGEYIAVAGILTSVIIGLATLLKK